MGGKRTNAGAAARSGHPGEAAVQHRRGARAFAGAATRLPPLLFGV